MNNKLAALCVVTICAFAAPALHAQQPAAGNASPQAPAAPAKPKPRAWHGSLNAGLGLADGVQAQKGYQLSLGIKRPFSDGGSFVAQAQRQYQKVTFPSEALTADRTNFAVGVDQDFSPHFIGMARSMFLRDELMYVDSRYEQLIGAGVNLFDAKKRFSFQFVPGVSIYKQDLKYSDDDSWQTGGGFYEKFTGKLNDKWSVENSFRYRRNFSDPDQSIESIASLQGMITKTLGMQMEYQYNYESIVPPKFPHYLQVLSAGLRFQF